MAAESLPAVVPLSPLHCPLRPGRDLAATVVETVTAPAAHAVVAVTAVVVVAVAAVGWLKEGRAWPPRSDGAQTKKNPWRLRLTRSRETGSASPAKRQHLSDPGTPVDNASPPNDALTPRPPCCAHSSSGRSPPDQKPDNSPSVSMFSTEHGSAPPPAGHRQRIAAQGWDSSIPCVWTSRRKQRGCLRARLAE